MLVLFLLLRYCAFRRKALLRSRFGAVGTAADPEDGNFLTIILFSHEIYRVGQIRGQKVDEDLCYPSMESRPKVRKKPFIEAPSTLVFTTPPPCSSLI